MDLQERGLTLAAKQTRLDAIVAGVPTLGHGMACDIDMPALTMITSLHTNALCCASDLDLCSAEIHAKRQSKEQHERQCNEYRKMILVRFLACHRCCCCMDLAIPAICIAAAGLA